MDVSEKKRWSFRKNKKKTQKDLYNESSTIRQTEQTSGTEHFTAMTGNR